MRWARQRSWLLLGVVAFGTISSVGLLVWRSARERSLLAASLSSRPDLHAFPLELQQRVVQCELRARSGPRPIVALGELAGLYHANGFLTEASQGYRGLLRLDSGNPRWPYLLASILAGFGQADEAIPLLHRTLAQAPAYIPARLRLGDVLLKRGDFAGAAKAYAAVSTQEPDNLYALLGLARSDIAADRWTEARTRLRRAMRTNPDMISVWNLLATVEEHLGDPQEAAKARLATKGTRRFHEAPDPWVDMLIQECYDPYRLCVAAEVAEIAGDTQKARGLLDRAIVLAPHDASAHRQLGLLLLQSREYAQARSHLEQAIAFAPEESDNWVYLIAMLNTIGDTEAVERTLAAGLARCPKSPSLHSERGRRLAAAGRFEEALAEFDESRRLRPEEPAAYIDMATIYFRLKRNKEAEAALRGALDADSENPFALCVLARYAISTGDDTGATEWIRRARGQPRVLPEDLDLLVHEFQQRFGRAP
jgi:tetratricopeptide (TPR) repeat protein